jgi:hypothetical protein
MARGGQCADLVTALALSVASGVVRYLLGVPCEGQAFFKEQSRPLVRGPEKEDVTVTAVPLRAYLGDLVDVARPRSASWPSTRRSRT